METATHVLESRFENGVAASLKKHLVENLSSALTAAESRLLGRDLGRYFEPWFFDRPSKEPYAYQFAEAVSRLAEIRERIIADTPGLGLARQKAALAASSTIAIRISGYGSLAAGISFAPLESVARVFDYDADALRVFVEAFLPVAFAEVFDQDSAEALQYAVDVPDSLASTFRSARAAAAGVAATGPSNSAGDVGSASQARQKAELLWRVANGTLILPVLLALLVMFYGFKELAAIRESQMQLVQPILEHQAALLREDRARLGVPEQPDSATAPRPSRPIPRSRQ